MKISNHRLLISTVILVVITGCLYFVLLQNSFQSNWDDQWVIRNGYTDGGINVSNLHDILFDFYNGQYAPINQLCYTILYSLFKYEPFAFHLFSLLIHLLNTALVFKLIHDLQFYIPSNTESKNLTVAFLTSLLFGISPIMTESVAWLSASKVLLYVFFYLLAILFYLKYLRSGQFKTYCCVLILFLLSFGSKEQAVTLPICLLFLDYIIVRKHSIETLFYEKLPFLIVALYFGIVTVLSQANTGEGLLSGEAKYPFYQNIVFAGYSLLQYAYKCLLPLQLSYLYPFPNLPGEPIPIWFWTYSVFIVLMPLLAWPYLRHKWVVFGIGFFVINLLPVLHIIPISREAIVADRYVYLSAIGIFYIMSICIYDVLMVRKKLVIVVSFYFIAMAALTFQRIKVWENSETLKFELRQLLQEKVTNKSPNRNEI